MTATNLLAGSEPEEGLKVAGSDEPLVEGTRIGRFLVLRDLDGRRHAVAAGAVAAVCETDEGALVMLPGGRMVHLPNSLDNLLAWLDGR